MSQQKAFTLIELLIVLTIVAIALSIALPNFSEFIEQKKANDTIKRVKQAITVAKVGAVVNGNYVTLCKSRSGEKCEGNWEQGMIAFTDKNGDRKINQDDRLLRYFTFPEVEGTIRWRAFQNRQYLQITGQGFTRFQNGNFTYCPHNKKPYLARQIIINRTARVRFSIDSNGDGIQEDSRGRPIRC
ncbi:MAG: GspH/FimT family pseudopilin [Pseudohongiellaceae bacterium]